MQRRTFAKIAGGAGLGLLGGGGVLYVLPTRLVPLPSEPLRYFSAREYAIFTAVAEAMVEVPKGVPDVHDAKVALKADQFMARNIPDAQHDVHQLLSLFDNALAGFVLCGSLRPFSRMSLEGRRAYLAKWQDHPIGLIRAGFVALKKLSMSCYYASPETWSSIGYPGPMEAG